MKIALRVIAVALVLGSFWFMLKGPDDSEWHELGTSEAITLLLSLAALVYAYLALRGDSKTVGSETAEDE